jgi:hypothetical protein
MHSLSNGSIPAALVVRCSHDRRNQIFHLFLVAALCLKQSGEEVPEVKTNILWKDLYTAAMLELDRANLPGRIEAAQAAIRQAMEERTSTDGLGAAEDRQAMTDALRNLQTLQRVEFRTSAPATSQGQFPAEG